MNIPNEYYQIAIKAAIEAGKAVMDVYSGSFGARQKTDGSPITLADERANDIIMQALERTGIPAISEESPKEEYEKRRSHEYLWIIDPVDGTREFVDRNGEFTINIALIFKQKPLFGIVSAPALDTFYIGWKDTGAYKCDHLNDFITACPNPDMESIHTYFQPIGTKSNIENPALAVSRSHLTPGTRNMIDTLFSKTINILSKGSSLKFCLLAEGAAQYYVRADSINEWDTAAGHALLIAAGGIILSWPHGRQLLYNKENLVHPGFIAMAGAAESDQIRGKFPS